MQIVHSLYNTLSNLYGDYFFQSQFTQLVQGIDIMNIGVCQYDVQDRVYKSPEPFAAETVSDFLLKYSQKSLHYILACYCVGRLDGFTDFNKGEAAI